MLIFRISAYGPGISAFGAVAHTPANFTVETVAAGKGNQKKIENNYRFKSIFFVQRKFLSIFPLKLQ